MRNFGWTLVGLFVALFSPAAASELVCGEVGLLERISPLENQPDNH